MLNIFFPKMGFFLISIITFFTFFIARLFLIRKPLLVFVYYTFIFCILCVAVIGSGGVQNDGYERLEQFIMLEKNNQLEQAKNNPALANGMLKIDLEQFKNSAEFRAYLETHGKAGDIVEVVLIGWFYALLAEFALILSRLRRWLLKMKKTKGLF